VLGYLVLHDAVVAMGVNANIGVMRETKRHDVAEDAMNVGITGYPVDDMIG
jgi:hypothetical protein